MYVVVIPQDPTLPLRAVEAPGDEAGFAEWARGIVEGYLELHIPNTFRHSGLRFWINEDAKMLGLLPNLRATRLCLLAPHDFIAGDVVVTGSKGVNVTDFPLPVEEFETIVMAFITARPSGGPPL